MEDPAPPLAGSSHQAGEIKKKKRRKEEVEEVRKGNSEKDGLQGFKEPRWKNRMHILTHLRWAEKGT